jgi:hypothetical protein
MGNAVEQRLKPQPRTRSLLQQYRHYHSGERL